MPGPVSMQGFMFRDAYGSGKFYPYRKPGKPCMPPICRREQTNPAVSRRKETVMTQNSEATKLQEAQQLKREELQAQEGKLKELHAELEKLNSKVHSNEKLSLDDTKYISELGWLAALSVTIATIASTL
jgi:hypothetical protein